MAIIIVILFPMIFLWFPYELFRWISYGFSMKKQNMQTKVDRNANVMGGVGKSPTSFFKHAKDFGCKAIVGQQFMQSLVYHKKIIGKTYEN